MANITKRTNKNGQDSYLIRVFVDQKSSGSQTVKSKTYKPAPGMSKKQIERELNRQATLFEESVKTGLAAMDGRTRFEDYAARWMEATPLAPKTRSGYEGLLKRINASIGHIRLDKLQAFHLEALYKNLAEDGISKKGRYASADNLEAAIKKRGLTQWRVAKNAGIASATVGSACAGNRISIEKAEQIAAVLKVSMKTIFTIQESTAGLSDKTILHHHRLISAILSKAKKERLVPFNVASEHATAPKMQRKEAVHLDDEQAQHVIELLFEERDIRIKASLILLFYSGVRRGELCGLPC